MPGKRGRRPKSAPLSYDAKPPRTVARSRALIVLLIASFLLPLAVLFTLRLADVRLGQGYFAILYSPVPTWRLPRAVPAIGVGTFACAAVWALAQRERAARVAGMTLFSLAMLAAGAWAWWAPPEPVNQHSFNLLSLSTDGAFTVESMKVTTLPAYLRNFPQQTLHTSPAEMGGTRVLSNPPLTTVLAYTVRRAFWNPADNPGRLERALIANDNVDPHDAPSVAHALRVSVALMIPWVLSGWAAYLLGRLFLSPAGAAAFAVIVTFNPCTVHYSPGKDPGQLLTINLMLWAWFAAWQRKSLALAALGGALLTIGSTAGLVHIWVALIAFAATLWESWSRGRALGAVVRNTIAAGIGGMIVCAVAQVTLDWNIPRTLAGVSSRWTELQSTFAMSRPIWYAIGLPIFLLFLGPGIWTLLGLNLRRRRKPIGFGTRLALCTLAVMLLIYGPLGVTYELPRLWIAFLPTLALGLAIDRSLMRGPLAARPRAAAALVLIVGAQVAFTALHWTQLDARESELRLTENRFFN